MLTHEVKRGFATKICILAGSKSYDVHGATVMQNIKKFSKEPVEFIGIGGPRMKEEGLEKSLFDVNAFLDKPFYPYKNFFPKYVDSFIHPPTLPIKINTHKALEKMGKDGFFRELYEAQPDLILTLGNQVFMSRLYSNIARLYSDRDSLKPPMTYYDSLIINHLRASQHYLDHVFYTTPKDPVNWRYYTFPSTYVGKFGAARALEYLYKNSEGHKSLAKENTLYISETSNAQILENLVREESARFRSKHEISEEATIFFAMPGNTSEEIKKALPLIHGSVQKFLQKFSDSGRQVAAENFALVIVTDQLNHQEISGFVSKNKWPCKIILATTEEEKFSAMAASDMGLVVNGDAVSECAVYQLPTIIVDPSNFFNTYFKLLYNSFSNDVNIARNGEIYPELHHTQAHPGKVVELWSEWYMKPKLRFKYVQLLEQFVPKLIPAVKDQLKEENDATQKEAVHNGTVYKEHYNGEYLMAQKIIHATKVFKNLKSKELKRFEIPDTRKQMMKEIGPEFEYLPTDYV